MLRANGSSARRGRTCRLIASFFLVISVAALLAGCGSGGSNASEATTGGKPASFYTGGVPGGHPVQGGTLAIATYGLESSLDPAQGTNTIVQIAPQIFDQLVEYLPGHTTPQPGVAKSWTISPDGLTYDFKLRKGIRFSNGEPLTATDVAFTLERLTDPEINTSGQFIFPNTFKSITVVNPYEIRFVLTEPISAMLYSLADGTLSILPKNVVSKESEASFATDPVGSGPFMVKSFKPGQTLELTRNPYYWKKGLPHLDGVNFTVTEEANQRVLAVKSGQAAVADAIPFSQISELMHSSDGQMVVQPTSDIDDLLWKNTAEHFSDLNVRKALAYATPIEDIIKTVYHGYAEPANTIIQKSEYWEPSAPYYEYDLAKAKKFMSESSFPNGFSATILTAQGDPDGQLLASILKSAWAEVGVDLTIRPIGINSLIQEVLFQGHEYEVAALPSGTYAPDGKNPDNLAGLIWNYPSGTHGLGSWYNDPKLTRLMVEAEHSTSEAFRKQAYHTLQTTAMAQVQMLPIAWPPVRYFVNNEVHEFEPQGAGWVRYENVYLSPSS